MPTEDNAPASATQELTDDSPCPNCGEPGLWRECVDVGLSADIHGPFGCEACGWSEDARYDRTSGPAAANSDYTDRACDQWGMAHFVGPSTPRLHSRGFVCHCDPAPCRSALATGKCSAVIEGGWT